MVRRCEHCSIPSLVIRYRENRFARWTRRKFAIEKGLDADTYFFVIETEACDLVLSSDVRIARRYSNRNACMGSMRVARRAGRNVAAAPTPSMMANTIAKVSGSLGFTP